MTRFGAREIKELLNDKGFRFSKHMGQNFLVDANIPDKIVRLSGIDSSCGVVEAGPGVGALTEPLSRAAGRVLSVELDTRLLPVLNELFAGSSNVEIINKDILKLDLAEVVKQNGSGLTWHVCSNLPYGITTPALTAFINAGVFETITVMIQREVARRICSKPGSPEYGSFTVFVNYHNSELQSLFDVPPECFIPQPSVYSTVISLGKRDKRLLGPADEALFFRVVRAAFGQRRKTLANALSSSNALCDVNGKKPEKDEIESIITSCGFDARVRGETLGLNEFMRLSASLKLK